MRQPRSIYRHSFVSLCCFIAPAISQADSVTFYFGGMLGSSDRSIAGSITYETTTPAVDVGGPFGLGERLLYAGAVTDISFVSSIASRNYSGGDTLVYNDYQSCISYTVIECFAHHPEDDRVDFRWAQPAGESFQLVLNGNAQNFLASGALPNSALALPVTSASLYWFGLTSGYELAGNVSIGASAFPTPSPVPEPATALMLLTGLAVVTAGARMART